MGVNGSSGLRMSSLLSRSGGRSGSYRAKQKTPLNHFEGILGAAKLTGAVRPFDTLNRSNYFPIPTWPLQVKVGRQVATSWHQYSTSQTSLLPLYGCDLSASPSWVATLVCLERILFLASCPRRLRAFPLLPPRWLGCLRTRAARRAL